MHIEQEGADSAFFAARSTIVTSATGRTVRRSDDDDASPAAKIERYIDAKYLTLGGDATTASGVQGFLRSADAPVESVSAVPPAGAPAAATLQWRLQCYRSRGTIDGDPAGSHLRLYFLQRAQYADPHPASDETRIERLGDVRFLQRTPPDMLALYAKVLTEASTRMGPAIHVQRVVEVSTGEDADVSTAAVGDKVETVLVFIAHRAGSTHSYFSSTSAVYRWVGLFAVTKNVEVFSSGIVVFAFRLRALDWAKAASGMTPAPRSFAVSASAGSGDALPALEAGAISVRRSALSAYSSAPGGGSSTPDMLAAERTAADVEALKNDRRAAAYSSAVPVQDRLRDLERDLALHYCLPRTSLTPLLHRGLLSAQEVAWAYCAWKYAYHFLARHQGDFTQLAALIRAAPAVATEGLTLLSKLRKTLVSNAFTEAQILDAICRWPKVMCASPLRWRRARCVSRCSWCPGGWVCVCVQVMKPQLSARRWRTRARSTAATHTSLHPRPRARSLAVRAVRRAPQAGVAAPARGSRAARLRRRRLTPAQGDGRRRGRERYCHPDEGACAQAAAVRPRPRPRAFRTTS